MNKHRISPMIVRVWRERYEDGETAREIANSIKQFGFAISHSTIIKLIRNAGGLIRQPKKLNVKDIMLG